MTTTPNTPNPDEDESDSGSSQGDSQSSSAEVPGAEMGIAEDEGSSFEPEEDPDASG